ncbi:hypothetical protein [uncultured Candidatus Puniceispirillum sp.]|uniref:hypothetical protein n=1 Tax=uncultured Candidatus Puniceispirillum sp. TaxID=1985115 RepID=UPI0032B22D27
MEKTVTAHNQAHLSLRAGNDVMRLARMGSFHQSRLSFMRVLLRRLKSENWTFKRPVWKIDANGVGVATYTAIGPHRTYTLVAFAHDLPDELRSDRVIAEAWDATFSLHDGDVRQADIERLKNNVPLQEAGRISDGEFVLSRANKSVRLFDYVRNCLATGIQPDLAKIEPIGYLMRTSAVYGSGKFGAADRNAWADRPEFAGSFQPELLAVWLIRAFTIDMVEHMAKIQAPDTAVTLAPDIRRRIGVGNSTGLGMAPFLINHPALIHAWINARETALGRVRAIVKTETQTLAYFLSLVKRAAINAEAWQVEHPYQKSKTEGLRADLASLSTYMENFDAHQPCPWDALYRWGRDNLTIEGQEQLVSLLIEPFGDLVDDLAYTMSADETTRHIIDGTQSIAALRKQITAQYGWAHSLDFSQKAEQARGWYVSEEKLEPRLGERFEEPIAPYEQPLAPGRDAIACYEAIKDWDDNDTVARFLMAHPEHRHIVRRAQFTNGLDYAEIRDNTIAADMMPIDLLRCKLSFFGATKFDPRSDRWLRITMYQGAPFPDELANLDPDDLVYPPLQ